MKLNQPDWSDHSHALAFTFQSLRERFLVHGIINAYREPLTFELPAFSEDSRQWRRCVDTPLASPEDFCLCDKAPSIDQATYMVRRALWLFLCCHCKRPSNALRR